MHLYSYLSRSVNKTLIVLSVVALFLASCSTKKSKWPNRAYHNTTSKYNAWFNGNEIIKEVEATLSNGHVDNFYKVIPVYRLGTLEDSKNIFTPADKAVKKGSMVIAKHNMSIRGKQFNRYIDDAYMLVGKAMYYKREYYAALEMFTFVTRNAVKNNRKDPIQHVANIWQARAYTEIGMLSDAQMAFDRSLNDKTLPNHVKSPLYMALTDYYLRQNNYPKALETVAEAVKYTKNKKVKGRLMFIQAQLLQKNDELKAASALYDKVLKMSPTYEMSFYCRINKARCFSSESGNSTQIRALLASMLKDPKNIDLADQIYYVLGELEEKEEKTDLAIDQYNKSLRATTTNTAQKGLSYLAIAEIYFEEKSYRTSAAYYDSCIAVLPKDYQDYSKVKNTQESLAELVKRYVVIERYDSLLRMSNLSKEELDKKLTQIIEKEEEALRKQRQKEAEDRAREEAMQASGNTGGPGGNTAGGPGVGGNGQWYFYNPSAMGFGFSEFRKIWGDRKLEDNWRRSNKQTVLPTVTNDPDDPANPDKATDAKDKDQKMTREDSIAAAKKRLMKDLPADTAMKRAYADSVREAFYALGMIYRERLNDLKKSVETFEEFLKKYPGDQSEATIYYQLYRIFLKMPDNIKAEKYKNLLLTKFPNSEYAQIIRDPNFFTSSNLSRKETEVFYEETYRLYHARAYKEVVDRCRNAEIKFTGNPLLAKFSLLKALAIGKLKDINAFRGALQEVVKGYPGDTVEVKAKQLLKSLDKAQGLERDSAEVNKPSFTYRADTTHILVVSVEDRKLNLNDFKNKLSDFNTRFYSLKNYEINGRLLGTNYQLVTVQKFNSKKEGQDYLATLDNDDDVFSEMDMDAIDVFIISAPNYALLMKDGNIKEYIEFYRRVYE